MSALSLRLRQHRERLSRAFATPSAATLFCLGFASGLPFLLVGGITLSTWLREAGFALSTIGFMSYIGFFYVLKFLWAPLIDKYPLPWLGRRKGYLVTSIGLLIIALSAMGLSGPNADLGWFIGWVALTAFAGATLDIVVDAYRIEIATPEQQAALSATYILGYRIALIISGAFALYFAELWGWTAAYLLMAAFLVIPLIVAARAREPQLDSYHTRPLNLQQAFTEPFGEFFQRHGVLIAIALLVFVGLFKLPDQMIGALAAPFYVDSGFSKAEIATVSKLYGVWIGIAGAFLGGVCVALWQLRHMLWLAAILVAGSNIAFLLMSHYPGATWAFVTAISADNLSQGFAGVVMVAFMSSLTHPQFTATQYALLASLANLPGKFIGGVSGVIVEATSYTWLFVGSSLAIIPTLLVLAWLWRHLNKDNGTNPSDAPPQKTSLD